MVVKVRIDAVECASFDGIGQDLECFRDASKIVTLSIIVLTLLVRMVFEYFSLVFLCYVI